jgi:hypothetical protein
MLGEVVHDSKIHKLKREYRWMTTNTRVRGQEAKGGVTKLFEREAFLPYRPLCSVSFMAYLAALRSRCVHAMW